MEICPTRKAGKETGCQRAKMGYSKVALAWPRVVLSVHRSMHTLFWVINFSYQNVLLL